MECHVCRDHLKSIRAVLVQHNPSCVPQELFKSSVEVFKLENRQFRIASPSRKVFCRDAGEEDMQERLGGREGSLSVAHPDHAKSLVKRRGWGRHGKQSDYHCVAISC